MRTYSGKTFTYIQLKTNINDMVVNDNDIIIFYYSKHGINWNDDKWPHIALADLNIQKNVGNHY